MPTIYRPRRPRASPLWQIIHHGWDEFQANYESSYRKTHGPLRSDANEVGIWGGDPATCPCCRTQMKNIGTITQKAEIEFFLKLWGMWEGIISLPPPPDPPFDIETMEPEALPPGWELLEEHLPPPEEWWHQHDSEQWRNPELPLEDGKVLVFDAEPLPPEEVPVFSIG